MLTIVLNNLEKAAIKERFSTIEYDPLGKQSYITALRKAAYHCFPERVINTLETQRASLAPHPYILFENLPQENSICGSPSFDKTGKDFKIGTLSENIIVALGALIGEPYSIVFEGRELINNLTPQKDSQNEYTGLGSAVELDFHIENSALKLVSEDSFSPMGMFLFGIRKDPEHNGPKTFVADARLAMSKIEAEDVEVLRGNNFLIHLPYRWRNQDGLSHVGPSPLIIGPKDYPQICAAFYPGMVTPLNTSAEKSFHNFHQAIKSIAIGIYITPGRAIYIDNRFALHSREKFNATYDENGYSYRWLQRLFIVPNLWSFRSFMKVGERVFDPSLVINTMVSSKNLRNDQHIFLTA